MCELLGISSNLPVDLTLSLDELARHGGETGPHRDGWGVAYYAGRDVFVIREPRAAAESPWVRFVRHTGLRSTLIVAHIRRATRGARELCNTQPFARELAGRMHVFAHNGDLPGADALGGDACCRPIGDTDSERAFCALLARLRPLWSCGEVPPLEKRAEVVREFAAELRELGPANFLYADGDALFAHGHRRKPPGGGDPRPPGLTGLCRRCAPSSDAFGTAGIQVGTADQHVALVASVPLSGEAWRPLEEGELVVLRGGEIQARWLAHATTPLAR